MAFDYDLLTIGAGSGGVAAARRAGNYGARTAICEKDQVGGTCVLRGCIPKKLLVYASRFAEELEDSVHFGWSISDASMDWPTLIKNKNLDEIKKFIEYSENMFGSTKLVLEKKWKDFIELFNKKNISRKECLLLPIRTVLKALKL